MRILLLIRSLDRGGAERQVAQLARTLATRGHAVTLVSFYPGGVYRAHAAETGATTLDLGKRNRFDLAGPIFQLRRIVREFQPDVVYSFMPSANLLSLLLRFGPSKSALVWGIRATRVDASQFGPASRLIYWLQRALLRLPDLVICNSEASRKEIASSLPRAVVVVENGVDVERFRPDERLRAAFRQRLDAPPQGPVIGIVGRIDPLKDHGTFLRAAARIMSERDDVRFVVVGTGGVVPAQLTAIQKELGLDPFVTWVEGTSEVEVVYNGLDLLISSSVCESFPNVIAEAMACGLPVVATDVGDSARIVGHLGRIVQAGSDAEIARAALELLRVDRIGIADESRRRIVGLYGVTRNVERTEAALSSVLLKRSATELGTGSSER